MWREDNCLHTYRKNNSDSAAVNQPVKMFFQNAKWRSSLFSLDNKLDVFQEHKQKVTSTLPQRVLTHTFLSFFSSLLSLLKEEPFEGSKV